VNEALRGLVIALADDELIIGHRHSEWTGYAPHIEEDVAFASIAQDEIGHASSYYSLIASDTGEQIDALALGRQPDQYRNAILCELPNQDWGFTLARHWLYDHADDLRLQALQETSDAKLQQLVTKIRREERYHLLHADYWMKRIAQGPVDARARIIAAMARAFPAAAGLFEPFEQEAEAVYEGWMPVSSAVLGTRFMEWAIPALDELGLPGPVDRTEATTTEFVASSSGDLIAGDNGPVAETPHSSEAGGRRGRHTQDLRELWSAMTTQYRDNEGATW
jgi:ring-1,2-phenylacetyl-CoA epoxidase subunit PaaC